MSGGLRVKWHIPTAWIKSSPTKREACYSINID